MCWTFDFSIVILEVMLDTFCTSFGYKNWNIETNTSKFCIKVYFNGLFWMKNFDLEIFVGFGWFWLIWAKNSIFLQKVRFKGWLGNLFHLQGMSYNNENWQVDAGRCFGKLISGGILIFWIFWILSFSKKNLDEKN